VAVKDRSHAKGSRKTTIQESVYISISVPVITGATGTISKAN
jgi:hypothetical protein